MLRKDQFGEIRFGRGFFVVIRVAIKKRNDIRFLFDRPGIVRKDVVNVMPLDSVAVEFVAENPGDTLRNCARNSSLPSCRCAPFAAN